MKRNKINIGIIGIGYLGKFHLEKFLAHKNCNIEWIVDLNPKNINKKLPQTTKITDNYKDIADDVDAVSIVTPTNCHYEIAKFFLAQKKHVLIEKPMTTNSSDAEDLFKLAKEVKKEILVPNGFNFTHFMPKAEQYIKDGIIGEIKHIDAAFSSSLVDLFQGIPLSESNDHTFKPLASTWSDPNKGGGYGWGQLSHMFGGVFKISNLTAEKAFCFSVHRQQMLIILTQYL